MQNENDRRPCPNCGAYTMITVEILTQDTVNYLLKKRQIIVTCVSCNIQCCFFCLTLKKVFEIHGDTMHRTDCLVFKIFPNYSAKQCLPCKQGKCIPNKEPVTSDSFWKNTID